MYKWLSFIPATAAIALLFPLSALAQSADYQAQLNACTAMTDTTAELTCLTNLAASLGSALGSQTNSSTNTSTNTSAAVYKPIDNFIFGYQSTSTTNPLQTAFYVYFAGDAMCDGASYSIDYGDGNSGSITLLVPCSTDVNPGTVFSVASPSLMHTYTATSTYTAKLERNNQAIETLSVNAGGSVQTALTPSVTSGTAPLPVTFTTAVATSDVAVTNYANLFLGDSQGTSIVVPAGGGQIFQHTYTVAGTYTAALDNASSTAVFRTATIIVHPTTNQNENDVGTATCPALTHTLQYGDTDATTGGEVSKLQQFLTDYFNLGGSLVVGTFGPQTEKYVKQFQSQNGISPVGWVGPQTRAAIAAACANGGGTNTFSFSANPATGTPPLIVDFAYTDPNQNQIYNISFGDGSAGSLVYNVGSDCSAASGCAPRYDATHTYRQTGMYIATLTHVINPCGSNPSCTTPVQVKQVATTSVTVGSGNTSLFSATPTSGAAPLAVVFKGNLAGVPFWLDFGDGTAKDVTQPICDPVAGGTCPTSGFLDSHTYTSAGTYTAVLRNSSGVVAGTATITVTNGTSTSCIVLTHNLYLDRTDAETLGDVTTLQNFLIAQGDMTGPTTGFFGPLTLQAVQAWQAANGVISSGTPETTGYGYIGPKTRAAMAKGCNVPPPPPLPPPGSFSASPMSGTAPLPVTFDVPYLSLDATLAFGDGATTTVAAATCTGACPQRTLAHTYAAAGTYTAQLTQATSSVVCTGVSYDPNNPMSFLNLGGSNCSNVPSVTVFGSVTITVSGTTTLAPLSTQCSADGASVTLTWPFSPSAKIYYPALYMPVGNTCPAGWANNWTQGPTMGCAYLTGTTMFSITASVPPGTSDAAQVYASSDTTGNQANWTKIAVNPSFTCTAH